MTKPTKSSKDVNVTSIAHSQAADEWWTYAEVCAYLKKSRYTVDKWRARREVEFPKPKVMPDRSLLFRRSEIVSWLESMAVAA